MAQLMVTVFHLKYFFPEESSSCVDGSAYQFQNYHFKTFRVIQRVKKVIIQRAKIYHPLEEEERWCKVGRF